MSAHNVRLIYDMGDRRREAERAVIAAGYALPMTQRMDWSQQRGGSWFVHVRCDSGQTRGGFGVNVAASRALPGCLVLRVERFGGQLAEDAIAPALNALTRRASQDCRVLRVHVEVFSPEAAVRRTAEQALNRLEFAPAARPRRYTRTARVDLRADEASIFASLHPTARRHIRAVNKHPVEVAAVAGDAWVPRMTELVDETMRRTGGAPRSHDWSHRMNFAQRHPELARLVGLFRTDTSGPGSLLAFAWACHDGDHAHYDTAASTRATDLKMPLNYAIAWDLISWAKRNGAHWFDFGGITAGAHGDTDDLLGGISDFKRYFSRDVIDVGGEWVFEPHWLQSQIARAASRTQACALSLTEALSRFKRAVIHVG